MAARSRTTSSTFARDASAYAQAGWRSAAFWRENNESFFWAVALALIIRTFIVAPFKIPSGSMRPTLIEGDRILVNKFIYRFHPPQRGDVVVFYFPLEWRPLSERAHAVLDSTQPPGKRLSGLFQPSRPFIKRLIGVEGDTVEIRDGHILVNGQRLDTNAVLTQNQYSNQGSYGQAGHPIRVPQGAFFVLGDNSRNSQDSRFWGFVPKELMIGKALCVFWPLPRWRILR